MSKVKLVTDVWETEEEICRRTGSEPSIVAHALKSCHKDGLLSCLWPDTTSSKNQELRFRLRAERYEPVA